MTAFTDVSLPSESEEVWRYSRISELDLSAYTPLPLDRAREAGIPDELGAVVAAAGPYAALAVVRNGRLAQVDVRADGVSIEAGDADPVPGEADVFTALNRQFAAETVLVRIRKGVVVEHPILVVHLVDGDGAAVFPRLVVEAGEASQATLLDHVASRADVRALVVPVVQLHVADAANFAYLNVQELGPLVWQIGYQSSEVARDATLHSALVALGGDYARVRTDSRLSGQGATSELLAVYFGDGTQTHDFRTMQDHDAPKTTSDLLFKGAVEDRAHSVYTGLIRVRNGAAGTNAFQTNRNLVLTEGAHADSVPNLEIEENDVRCSHASAVGPIDEDQRYYLEARGVPTEVANRLIVLGFFNEVIERTPIAGLRPRLRRAVAAKLEGGAE